MMYVYCGCLYFRMVGPLFDQPLIGIFPFPQVVENGFGAERYLTYSVSRTIIIA